MHYLNNAACGLLPDKSVEAIHQHLMLEQSLGAYRAARLTQDAQIAIYDKLGQVLGASPAHIALSNGNSDGWGRIVGSMRWREGDQVLVNRAEWGGNLGTLMYLSERHGVDVQQIPSDPFGLVDLPRLSQMLKPTTRLVALTWVPANSDLIQPAEAIGALCAQFGVPFLIDAAQAVGQIPVDVERLDCAALTAPGRKWLRGPRGTGFVYIRPDFLQQLEPLAADHLARPWSKEEGWQYRMDTKRLEMSEVSVALRMGLGAALGEWLDVGITSIYENIQTRAQWLRSTLATLDGVKLCEGGDHPKSGIVTFTSSRQDAAAIHRAMQAADIELAISPASFTPWDMEARCLDQVIRVSPGYDTSWESLDHFATKLARIL